MTFEEWMESQQEGVAACDHITFGRKVWAACVASRDAEVESLRQQLAAAKEEITLDEQRVADLMSQVGELSEQISKRDAEVAELQGENIKLREQVESAHEIIRLLREWANSAPGQNP